MRNTATKSVLRTIVIGSLFVSLSAYGWTIELDFEQNTAGQRCAFDDAANQSFVSTARASNGTRSCEFNINQGATGFGDWGGIVDLPSNLTSGDEIWIRVKTYWPTGFNYDSTSEGNRLKFIRLHTRTSSDSNQGYDDWYINPQGATQPFRFIFEGEQVWEPFGTANDRITHDTWETYEIYMKLDSVSVDNGGQARIRVWKNGNLMEEITGRKTLVSSASYADLLYFFTYWNGGAPKTQSMYVDEIVLTSDTPTSTDNNGNPFVGMGETPPRPNPPSLSP